MSEADTPVVFRLSVDEGGEWVVACGPRIVLGHARGGACELPLLADVDPECAVLERADSLRDGPSWKILPRGAARITRGELTVPAEGAVLSPGVRVRLGANLVVVLSRPDPASESAVLALEGGADCLGARRVLLLGEGLGGRVRIGPERRCHVPVQREGLELSILRAGDKLVLASPAGVREQGEVSEAFELEFPPRERRTMQVGERSSDEPPFVVTVAPVGVRA